MISIVSFSLENKNLLRIESDPQLHPILKEFFLLLFSLDDIGHYTGINLGRIDKGFLSLYNLLSYVA